MLTDLYNAIMQLIFIITGLVSVKTMVGLITELVGQGDALKDGEETSKEVKKRVAHTAGAAVLGAGATAKVATIGARAIKGGLKAANSFVEDRTGYNIGRGSKDVLKTMAMAGPNAIAAVDQKLGGHGASAIHAAKGVVGSFKTAHQQRNYNYEFLTNMKKSDPAQYEAYKTKAALDPTSAEAAMFKGYNRRWMYDFVKDGGKGIVKHGKNFASESYEATKDFRKHIASVIGLGDAYKDFAKDSNLEENRWVEGLGSFVGYKSEKRKGQEQTEREAQTYAKEFIAVNHGYKSNKEKQEAGDNNNNVRTENETLNNATFNASNVNMKANNSNTSTGNSNVSSGASTVNAGNATNPASKAINANIANPVAISGGQIGLNGTTLDAIRSANNQTARNINSRLRAVLAGLSMIDQSIENNLRTANKTLENIATEIKGSGKKKK